MGMGYCADAESVNKEMVGRDGKTWVVGVKNSTKIWMRAPEDMLSREKPVLSDAKTKTEEETVVDDDLPPLEEIPFTNDADEEVDLEDPFGWNPEFKGAEGEENTLEVIAKPEAKVDDTPVEPKKKAGRPKKIKTDAVLDIPKDEMVEKADEKPVEKADEKPVEPKKKAGRPKKIKTDEEKVVIDGEVVEPEIKKRGRPAKAKVDTTVDGVEGAEEKPKRKYVRKSKNTEENTEGNDAKKVRKPRAKTEYNEFIGKIMKDLREKNKENKDLKTTDYMKMAIAEWKTYKISKTAEVVA